MVLAWILADMEWPAFLVCVGMGWWMVTARYLRARRAKRDAAHDTKKRW